ncbi:MAG: SUMF1/EgtB/PvdO family nonheme iron enzyme [Betaproteobacteria bacterium]|nr:SUMF1/EgtB/PvdO family nonheme iron enzyme [Betaproteobacteria bacterium]
MTGKTTGTPKVFISSTLEDLAEYREKAREACERAGFQPLMCERWPAGGEPPLATCLARVDPADLVVVIVAHRHGWAPSEAPGDGTKSITRLECERAKAHGKTAIPFIVSEDADWDRKLTEEYRLNQVSGAERHRLREEVNRNVEALDDFKSWLNSNGTRNIKGFTTPEELCKQILHALTAWAKDHGLGNHGPSNATIRQGYLSWLRRECASVELLGLDAIESSGVRLGHVYVPAVTPPEAKGSGKEAETRQRGQPELLLHRLGADSLYVPGAPGSGKSTFCRWLALVVAEGAVPAHPVDQPEEDEEVLPEDLKGRFPLLCRLRDWSGHPECLAGNGRWTRRELEDSLCRWISLTRPGELTADALREELNAGRCMLILDGVDEVPEEQGAHLPRRNLLTGLADALPAWLRAGNRVLLTSRPYGLDEADRSRLKLRAAELQGMPPPLQSTFIRRWYAATDPPQAAVKAEGLIDHLDGRPELGGLRSNPILLTALCVKYGEGQRLPADVFKLYQAVTTQVLYKRYPLEKQHDRPRIRLAAVALGMHRGEKDRPRSTPSAAADLEEIDRILCDLNRTDPLTEDGALGAAARREDLLSNSGLLLPRANRRAAFYHLSFQEFFAAVRLKYIREAPASVLAAHAGVKEWRRTLTFLFCAFADESPQAAIDAFASLEQHLEPARLAADPLPALLLCDCLEVAHARGWNLRERYGASLQSACDDALPHLAPPERAYLWRTLGRLGWDERHGVGVKDGLPDIAWSETIRAGEFPYGNPPKPFRLKNDFRLALYPVTHAQFQCFIDDWGYETDAWWQGLAERPQPEAASWPYPNHPRETVSWYEAMAFCRWLDAKLPCGDEGVPGRWQVRLPTEQEWERAARGMDGRKYPWGKDWDQRKANGRNEWGKDGEFFIGQTTAVGIYPDGTSPVGALDMAGNVWEWCSTKYEKPNDSTPGGDAPRVLRGGSWFNLRGGCRCAARFDLRPDNRRVVRGFRVCCAPPIDLKR